MLHAAQEKARGWAHAATSSLEGGWDSTSRQARRLASRVADATGECCESVGGFVRRHPLASLAAAGLAGFALAGTVARAAFGSRRGRGWH
jgi:hypothetical protein